MQTESNTVKELKEQIKKLEGELDYRKSVEKAVEASRTQYELLVENMPHCVFQKDLDGRFILANTNFCKSLGKPWKEIIGKTDFDFYSEELAAKYVADDKKVIESDEVFEDIEEHKLLNGTKLLVHVIKTPVYNLQGEIIGTQCIFWDVTERKYTKALKESERKYRKLVESANDAIFITDTTTGKIIDVNKKAEKLMEMPAKELIGIHYTELHPQKEKEYYEKLFKGLITKGSSISKGLFVVGKNGCRIPVEVSTSVTEIGGKEILQGIYRDQRESIKAKEKELKLQAKLIQSEKLSSVGLLGAGVAHELNSPLTGLLTLLRLRRKDSEENSGEYKKLNAMVKAAEHMAKIINDLTAFARTSKNEFSELDVNKVIESTLSFSSQLLTRQDVEIVKNYSENLYIYGDKSQLQQVILNIITNSKYAMPEGGEFIINTYNSKDQSKVYIEFEDNGEGIRKEDLDDIFAPFFTTKDQGEGTGLGLFVSKGIVENHKGEIEVDSKIGKGSKFTIVLPAVCKLEEK